jgi:chemotaxis-related protein WspD
MSTSSAVPGSGAGMGSPDRSLVDGECWRRIGVSGDRSCPELDSFIHCRNCPVFAQAARTFFDRPAPAGYLAEWTQWLADSDGLSNRGQDQGTDQEEDDSLAHRSGVSLLIFRLGDEWLAFRTVVVAEVTTPKPVHRVPHRSNHVFVGLVNLQGQAQLCVSLHGLLNVEAPASSHRLIVLRDPERAELWAFAADEVQGVHRVPRSHWRSVPSTLSNPAVGFSQAVLSWNERSVGVLDEHRVFSALRNFEP